MVGNLAPMRAAFFNGPNGQRLTEDQIRTRELIARTLLQSATDTSPTAGGWASILAKGAAGLASNYQEGKADAAASANLKATSDADNSFYSSLAGTLGGDTSGALPTPGATGEVAATSPQVAATPPDAIKSLIAEVVPVDMQAYATNLIGHESSFDPNAVSPTGATGLAQFTRGTGKQYGLVNDAGDFRSDPRANLNALVRLTSDNKAALTSALGRVPTDGELALAHQQGAQGAISLLAGKSVPGQNLAVNNVDPNSDPRVAAQKIMAFYGGSGGAPQTASLGPVTSQDATAALAPAGPYIDPQVTTAAQTPNPAVAQALLAPPQDTTSAAMPVSEALKGGRVGTPAITQQNFDDRMGGAAPAAAPIAPLDPSTVQDYGTQAPQAAPQQQAPVSLPKPVRPAIPPLNPAVIRALQDPNASAQTKQVAASLLTQYGTQRKEAEASVLKQQQAQQTIAQRQVLAQQLGLPTSVATDEDAWKAAAASVFGAPSTSTVNGKVVDNRTGKIIYSGGVEPTSDVKDFEYSQTHPGFAGYEQSMKKAGATTVLTGDNSSLFAGEMDKSAAKRFDGYISDGANASRTMGQIQQLADLGSQINTGKGAEIMATLGPYADALGIPIKGLPEQQAYQSITSALIPQMRPTGSGPQSDSDARNLLASIPSIGKTPEGNAIITQTFAAIQQQKIAAAQIAAQASLPKDQGGIPWQQAEKQIRDLGNPYETFNKYRADLSKKSNGQPLSSQGLTTAGASDLPPVPEGVEPEVWKFMTPEQRKLWQ